MTDRLLRNRHYRVEGAFNVKAPARLAPPGARTPEVHPMSVAEATRSPRTSNPPKRKALGDGLYVRRDGRYEHGYTCRAPHDECSGRRWHVVTLKATTKTTAKDEIAARVTALTRG